MIRVYVQASKVQKNLNNSLNRFVKVLILELLRLLAPLTVIVRARWMSVLLQLRHSVMTFCFQIQLKAQQQV